MTTIEADEWVLATYPGPAPLEIKYANRLYRIRPGIPTPIPQAAAHLWFGDPRARMGAPSLLRDPDGAVIGSIAPREDEVRRLRQKWGLPFGDERTFLNSDGVLGVPDVTITSLDGTDEYLTVLQDPLANGGTLPNAVPNETGMEAIHALSEQVRLLEKRMAVANLPDEQQIDADLDDVGMDDPDDVPHDNVHSTNHPSLVTPDPDPAPLFGGVLDEQ